MATSALGHILSKTGKSGGDLLISLMNSSGPSIKFLALNCLVHLYCDGLGCEPAAMKGIVLPGLIDLLRIVGEQSSFKAHIPIIFIYLLSFDVELLHCLRELGAVIELSKIVVDNISIIGKEKLVENSLLALAAFTETDESSRTEIVMTQHFLKKTILGFQNPNICFSACLVIKNLSRSPAIMRTSLFDADIALPVTSLLDNSSKAVQLVACGALCNMIVSFSSMKSSMLDTGLLDKFCSLVLSGDLEIKRKALLGLRNMLYQAPLKLKEEFIKKMPADQLFVLITEDSDISIREYASAVIRNMTCETVADLELALGFFGEKRLLDAIAFNLSSSVEEESPIRVECLYAIANICTGTKNHKDIVIQNKALLDKIIKILDNGTSCEKIAALWCIINLTWQDDGSYEQRVKILKEIGVDMKLRHLIASDLGDFDLRDRAKTAFNNFPSEMQGRTM